MIDHQNNHQQYEALRMAMWAVRDALATAASIAGRATDCFDGTGMCVKFDALRIEILRIDRSSAMLDIQSAVIIAREAKA